MEPTSNSMAVPSEHSPLVLQESQKTDHTPKERLRRFYSAPIRSLMSSDMDMDSLRISYAAKLVLAAVEARNVESAVDLFVGLNSGFINPLAYPLYRNLVVCVILGHLALALWEGGPHPLPLEPSVAILEGTIFVFYTADVLLNFWTFGAKQLREKKWHLAFAVLSIVHCLLLIFATIYALGDVNNADNEKQSIPRFALLAAHALRPFMLISQLKTTRRVFTNVFRTIICTGSFLALWAVLLVFFSVLGKNLFNSLQVSGYDAEGDNYDHFSDAILTLFILTTDENFPMAADPAFVQRPLVAYPFFVTFLLLFMLVIMPLLLGIVSDAYAEQHERQLARCGRKARNALLAAYYVLDEDGSMGLTQEQLVAVLTTEASIDINRRQAEQLWRTLVPEEAKNGDAKQARSGSSAKITSRSHSLPPTSFPVSSGAAGGTQPSTVQETPGRLEVGSFLRLADLLHEKVVDDSGQEFDDTQGGNEAVNGDRDSSDEMEYGRGFWMGSNGNACRIRYIREKLRRFASEAVHRPWFSRTSQIITVTLSLLSATWTPMSPAWHDLCFGEQATPDSFVCWKENALRLTETLVLLAFWAEMAIKVLAVGWRTLWRRDWAARFDFILLGYLMATYFVVGIQGNILAVYVDKHPSLGDVFDLPRSLVILRLLTVFPSLRELLETISTVFVMMGKIMVLYACVSYSFAAVGMAIFDDLKSDLLAPRYSFSSLTEAFFTLFFLTIANNWNDLLYPLIKGVSVGRWSALYFASYMLFCTTMVLDVLVGVVIEGFRVSRRGPDASFSRAASRHSVGVAAHEATINSSIRTDEGDATLTPPHRGTSRKASHRKYKQVKAEDIFRSAPKGELTAEDLKELEESVKAVEERLHQAWVNRLRSMKVPGEDTD